MELEEGRGMRLVRWLLGIMPVVRERTRQGGVVREDEGG